MQNDGLRTRRDNPVLEKSLGFAVDVVVLANEMPKTPAGFALAAQIIRSGTSIGANIQEGQRARSKKDFKNCFEIALKESSETKYWLDVISKSKIAQTPTELFDNLEQITKLLVAIVKKIKYNSE